MNQTPLGKNVSGMTDYATHANARKNRYSHSRKRQNGSRFKNKKGVFCVTKEKKFVSLWKIVWKKKRSTAHEPSAPARRCPGHFVPPQWIRLAHRAAPDQHSERKQKWHAQMLAAHCTELELSATKPKDHIRKDPPKVTCLFLRILLGCPFSSFVTLAALPFDVSW